MTLQEKTLNIRDLNELLSLLIPGKSSKIAEVRIAIQKFAENPLARHLLIIGPIGSGKSTVARVVALARHLAFLKEDRFKDIVRSLKFDGPLRLDKNILDHYEEVNVTSLVPSLAYSQLFGIVKGTATDVGAKPGLFEQAMYGHSSKDKQTKAAQITKGIVFLDEIADLAPELQPLLLSVLTGVECMSSEPFGQNWG